MQGTSTGRVRLSVVLLAGVAALAGSGCDKLKARDHLNQGTTAFRSGNYALAADQFKIAIDTDPTFSAARLYLATAYVQQFVPGVDTPENKKYADAAMAEFNKVLQEDPKNVLAMQSIASLYFQQKDFPNAEEWNKKVAAADPKNKEAYYTLGVIPWTEFIAPDREARLASKMKPEDQEPIKDPKLKAALKAQYWDKLTQGIEYEKKALEIDPEYADAMSYANLLLRYRADLRDTKAEFAADWKEADDWLNKGMEATKKKAAKKAAAGTTPPAE